MDAPQPDIWTGTTKKEAKERFRIELDDLFEPARQVYGASFKHQLAKDETLRNSIRQRFILSSNRFPSISFYLSIADERRKDEFFKTAGEGLAPPISQEDLIEDRFRLTRLRWLLNRQFEFETRYPAAYETLFPDRARTADRAGLYLPSFDIYVLGNNPRPMSSIRPQPHEEVDSWSYTYGQWVERSEVKRGVWPVRVQDLQGILLAILSREEFNERIVPVLREETIHHFEDTRVPRPLPVRITDLRLAKILNTDKLQDELTPLLQRLERPVNAESVILWKQNLMRTGSEIYEAFLDECAKENPEASSLDTLSWFTVTFATAALLLFVDLEMTDIKKAVPYRLAEQIASLAKTIHKLMKALEESAEELDALAANRAAGRQPRLGGEDYWSLRNYRMGISLEDLAKARGITPYSSQEVRGTRNWKARLKQALARGKEIEEKEYPRATAIFAKQDNPHIQDKAQKAYRFYRENGYSFRSYIDYAELAREIRVGAVYTMRGHEIASAYLQLGSCIEQGIPTTL